MLTTSKCRALGGRKLGQQCRWVTQNYIKRLANADDNWAQRAEQVCKGDRMSIIETLEQRGFVNQIIGTRPSLKKVLDHRRVGVYCGIDPTAPSMHVGHMVPFMALSWMYIHGYSVTFLLGGATARIGDPEGRLAAREGVSSAERKANMSLMHNQLKRFGASMERYAARRGYEREWAWRRSLRNNADWHTRLIWTDLLREMGQYLRIGPMLGRDSVKNRQEKGDGMSFAEFSYPLVQAWDWWVMFKTGTQIQIGGADQFGNILAGAEAVKQAAKHSSEWQSWLDKEYKSVQEQDRPELSEDPMGFTVPLLTTASGEKFGKSAGNAVWLDAGMTSVFELYQFWLRTADADVEKYLKLFTFLPLSEISAIMVEHQQDESKRVAQHKLAAEFTELVHGPRAAQSAEEEHRALFKKDMTLDDLMKMNQPRQPPTQQPVEAHPSLVKDGKPQDMEKYGSAQGWLPQSAVFEKPMSHVLWSAGLVQSKSEGQRLISNKGAYVGAKKGEDSQMSDSLSYQVIKESGWNWWKDFIIEDKLLILRTGKWRIKVINIVSDEEFLEKGLTCPGFNEVESGNVTRGGEAVSSGTEPAKSIKPRSQIPFIAPDDIESGNYGWDQVSPRSGSEQTERPVRRIKERIGARGQLTPKFPGARSQS